MTCQHTERRPVHPRDRVTFADIAALCGSVLLAGLLVLAIIDGFWRIAG